MFGAGGTREANRISVTAVAVFACGETILVAVVRDEFLPNGRNTEPFSWRGIAPHGRLARQTTQPQ